MSSNAFLTGSRVYGTPRPDSDIDLVICAEANVLHTLTVHNDVHDGTPVIRFGQLNVIVLAADEFERVRAATDECIAIRPVTRESAMAVFRRHGVMWSNGPSSPEKPEEAKC